MEEATMTCRGLELLVTLTLAILVVPLAAHTQPLTHVPRIGFVAAGSDHGGWPLAIEAMPEGFPKAFRQGLRELGYREGDTILVEYRSAEGHLDRIPGLVADLVQLPVDVLISGNGPTIRAAKATTRTIPVVMAITADPVAIGLVESMARPGGNLTGLTTLNRRLTGKRLEVFTEVVPGLARVGILADATEPGWEGVWPPSKSAGRIPIWRAPCRRRRRRGCAGSLRYGIARFPVTGSGWRTWPSSTACRRCSRTGHSSTWGGSSPTPPARPRMAGAPPTLWTGF
jgi:hypothetical protein